MNASGVGSDDPILLVAYPVRLEDDCACPESPRVLTVEASAFENDCACPQAAPSLLLRSTPTLYRQVEQAYVEETLPHAFRLLLSPYAPQGPVVVNAAAWARWQHFQQPQPLSEPVDFCLAEQALLWPVNVPVRFPSSRLQTLTVWLHVTNACNLDCPYCYVRKSSAHMREEIGLQALRQVFQTAHKRGFQSVKLKYAGGEATLHFGLLRKLATVAQKLALETGQRLEQVILSNGTLLKADDILWMLDNDVRLMISLDGLGEIHDRQRPTRSGRGSFERVRYVLEKIALPAGMRPFITVTITRRNHNHIAEVVRWVLERELPLSLNFYRQPLSSEGDLAAEEEALIQGMRAAYRVYEELLPPQPFLNGLLDRVKIGGHLHACGVGSSYLVITHEGKIAQCQMILEQATPPPQDGDLLTTVQQGFIPLISVEQKTGCATCRYRYLCAGGCPLETYRRTGRWDVPHPNCRIYKALLPEALRLEGLRLLKVHGYLKASSLA
ncbi:MAG: radical SAM protein [Anaerolineales bacterium]|nr:radical SAM protein [Anaerolineales bacterium]MDW8226399.1 radical SAM protein [Anaerolineales bacterium]